ncbi:MAG: hypothetical protein ACSHX4_04735 [Opitutaceae bacterium]
MKTSLILPLCFTSLLAFANAEQWTIDSQADWQANTETLSNLKFKDGLVEPTAEKASFQSKLMTYKKKKSAASITLSQSTNWENWNPIENIGPPNLGDAPVFLSLGPGNYWMFGRYSQPKGKKTKDGSRQPFVAESATLAGFDVPLLTTADPKQFNAPGGLEQPQGGYHAWQSHDMVNWVHHGAISDKQAKWMTTAEYVDGKAYFYYDFPNDQDPHLIIDENLTDGKIGKKMGMAFKDPSHGSDCAIIRDLDGKFHLILENWDPIKASARSWDSPLASHAVSDNGINEFKLLDPAVDYRTNPTGKFATYNHPHWHSEDPENYPTKVGRYEIHEPEQHAYGDWAAISIGGQYYLFGDYDPAGAHGSKNMSVAMFTAANINEPFKFFGNVGKGHPDPDIMFAEGQFYLATQQSSDFVSPGPWVESVEVRVGVDSNKDGAIDQWTDWQAVKESYDYIPGFAKQIARAPAQLDLSDLPEGYGFQFELRLTDTTENASKPILDQVVLSFE